MCEDHAQTAGAAAGTGTYPGTDPGTGTRATDPASPQHDTATRTTARSLARRALLVTSATAAFTLGTVTFASGAGSGRTPAGKQESKTISGTLPPGAPDFVYVPVEIPEGVNQIHVAYAYQRPAEPAGTQGNALDIGLFDERGIDLGGKGFRGWSGGARTEFFVRADDATPGYLAGPLNPGTWHVALGPYTVAPEGLPYEITISLTFGEQASTPKPSYPPERAKGRGRAWYRGDCHLHTWYSDGRRFPSEIGTLARAAGLDFINTSDHNTTSSHAHWSEVAGDDLLVLLGEEITTRNGHVLAIATEPGTFVEWRYRARDNRFGAYARNIRSSGGLVVPAHPHATCIGCNWKFGFENADAVEVWNGPYTADDEVTLAEWDNTLVAAVRSGQRAWLPAMGNSDAHRDPDVVGTPQTVVQADDLTRDAILAGIRAGRSYVAESSAVELAFSAAGGHGEHAGIGERLSVAADSPVTVRLEIKGAPGCVPSFVTDQGTLFTGAALTDAGAGTIEWRTTPSYAAYVRAEVRHPATVPGLPGALAAFTNPIFLGV